MSVPLPEPMPLFDSENMRNFDARVLNIRYVKPHFHTNALELVYCLKGSVQVVKRYNREPFRLNAGDIHSIDCLDVHHVFSDEDNLTIIFYLDLENQEVPWEIIRNIFFRCESDHCPPEKVEHLEFVKDCLLNLVNYKYSVETGTMPPNTDAYDTCCNLTRVLCEYFDWATYEDPKILRDPEFRKTFYRVFSYCNDHALERITLSDVAAYAGLSTKYCSNFFRKTVLRSFTEYMRYIHFYEAEHLLLTTDLPIEEIALKSGFADVRAMYKAFKDLDDSTPAEFREGYARYAQQEVCVSVPKQEEIVQLVRQEIVDRLLNWTATVPVKDVPIPDFQF